ncbi:hypothetical protein M1278_00050 [Candidatus Marsarchaeota archaeon]|nr:hypothetical protein [Candidatus Marsarchaeota archaeon]
MANLIIKTEIQPSALKAFSKNEVVLFIEVFNPTSQILWGESEINVNSPLSLSFDSELNKGKMRVGILEPNQKKQKKLNIYTKQNNYPDDYKINMIFFVYDTDGAIFERIDQQVILPCKEQ